jgi:hypothetical protein
MLHSSALCVPRTKNDKNGSLQLHCDFVAPQILFFEHWKPKTVRVLFLAKFQIFASAKNLRRTLDYFVDHIAIIINNKG